MASTSAVGGVYDPKTMRQVASGTDALDKNAFLTLLTTQLKFQDPMNPTDNTEFIAQLAQFSSLEQMQQLNTLTTTLASNTWNNMATSLLGHNVEALTDKNEPITGVVTAVKFVNGMPVLVINDKDIDPSTVSKVL